MVPGKSTQLRVLNLNVWHGRLPRLGALWLQSIEPPGQKQRRYDALVREIRRLDPDVIGLQECLPQPAFTRRLAADLGGYDGLAAIANGGVRIRGRGLPVGVGTGEGVSLLARKSLGLRAHGSPWALSTGGQARESFSFHLSERRVALAATVSLPSGERVGLVCLHLRYAFAELGPMYQVWERLRAAGRVHGPPPAGLLKGAVRHMRVRDQELRTLTARLDAFVEHVPRDRLIVMGDFNLDADAPQLVEWARGHGMVNALPATAGEPVATWSPDTNPNTRYSITPVHPDGTPKERDALLYAEYDAQAQSPDHLFVGRGWSIEDAQLACDRPVQAAFSGGEEVFVSDHYGVIASLAG